MNMADLFTMSLLMSIGMSSTLQLVASGTELRKMTIILNLVLAIIIAFKVDMLQVVSFVTVVVVPVVLKAVFAVVERADTQKRMS